MPDNANSPDPKPCPFTKPGAPPVCRRLSALFRRAGQPSPHLTAYDRYRHLQGGVSTWHSTTRRTGTPAATGHDPTPCGRWPGFWTSRKRQRHFAGPAPFLIGMLKRFGTWDRCGPAWRMRIYAGGAAASVCSPSAPSASTATSSHPGRWSGSKPRQSAGTWTFQTAMLWRRAAGARPQSRAWAAWQAFCGAGALLQSPKRQPIEPGGLWRPLRPRTALSQPRRQ